MKFEDAIFTHKTWKIKLSDYITRPDKSIKPEACHERSCELFKWLSSEEAKAYSSLPEFQELQKVHKAFHHTLGEIVFNANRGVQISEDMAIGLDSPFNRHAETLIRLLNKIKKQDQDQDQQNQSAA